MAAWHKIAETGDPGPGVVRMFEVAGEYVALCNVEGEYHAVEDVCTHDGGPLDQGELDGDEIECPRHGARFCVKTGKALCLPAIVGLRVFPVKLEGNAVLVEI